MDKSYKTPAIVLHSIAHSTKGHIAYLYTRAHGRVAYYIYSAKNGRATVAGSKMSLQPLTMVDIVAEPPQRGDLHRLKEVKNRVLSNNKGFDMTKSALSLYIAEFLYRVVKDSDSNPILFDFIVASIEAINELREKQLANFPLFFTINITKFLGYAPANEHFEQSYFDMTTSHYVLIKPLHEKRLDIKQSALLAQFYNCSLSDIEQIKLNRFERREMIEAVILFLAYHHNAHYKIESLNILAELFD